MSETTFREFHDQLEQVATEDGDYRLVTTGADRCPASIASKRFADRPSAAQAVSIVESYYEELRGRDRRKPYPGFIVSQTMASPSENSEREPLDRYAWDFTRKPSVGTAPADRLLFDFCRETLTSVFDVLSVRGLEATADAIVECYRRMSKPADDRRESCLTFLRSIATEFDDRLTHAEQRDVLRATAIEFSGRSNRVHALNAVLSRLASMELLMGYACSSRSTDLSESCEDHEVTLHDYALTTNDDRLITLPITIECFRWSSADTFALTWAENSDIGTWNVVFRTTTEQNPPGLVSVPTMR